MILTINKLALVLVFKDNYLRERELGINKRKYTLGIHVLRHICITRLYRLGRANYVLAPDKTNAVYWPNHLLPRRHTIHHLVIPYLMRVLSTYSIYLISSQATVGSVSSTSRLASADATM